MKKKQIIGASEKPDNHRRFDEGSATKRVAIGFGSGGSELKVAVEGFDTVTKDLNYQDTYHEGVGLYYRVANPWLLMAWFGYDTSPTSSSKDRSPILPLGALFRYAAGVQYDWNKDFSVGAAYTLTDAGKAKVNKEGGPLTGDLEGEYDTNFIHAFNLNFVYRF